MTQTEGDVHHDSASRRRTTRKSCLVSLVCFALVLLGGSNDIVFAEKGALYQLTVGKKVGFIDDMGNIVVEPQFDDVGPFSDGLAVVKVSGKYGFIDNTGKLVVAPKFDDAVPCREGLCGVQINGKWGSVDTKGRMVIEPRFSYTPAPFFDGLARVAVDGTYGFVDKTGKEIIEPKFDNVSLFFESLATVRVDKKYGFIDKTGEIVIKPQFDRVLYFLNGLAAVELGEKWGFIDPRGKVVIEYQFDDVGPFYQCIAIAKIEGKFGFIDKTGNMVIRPQFEDVRGFSDGLACVKREGKYGFIDRAGKETVETNFEHASSFSEEFARVKVGCKYGFIDKSGVLAIQPRFDGAASFENGLARVTIGRHSGYIDREGKFLWKPGKGEIISIDKGLETEHFRGIDWGLTIYELAGKGKKYIRGRSLGKLAPDVIYYKIGEVKKIYGIEPYQVSYHFRNERFYKGLVIVTGEDNWHRMIDLLQNRYGRSSDREAKVIEWRGPTIGITAMQYDIFTSSLEFVYLPIQRECPKHIEETKNEIPASWEIDGFRGLKWGVRLNETEGMNLVGDDETLNNVKIYERAKDSLSIGEVGLDSIRYSFYKNQFFLVTARYKSSGDIEKLHQALMQDLGPESYSVQDSHYRWHGRDVNVILSNSYGVCTAVYVYEPLFKGALHDWNVK